MSVSQSPAADAGVSASPPPGGEPLDVLVIGAGQAGLALSWHLTQRGIRYLVLDSAAEIGHSWRNRWDSLRLFTPSQYDNLPGVPFPGPADTYPTKDQVADYLRTYAETHAFPILTGTAVRRLERTDHGFAAHTDHGVLRARQVVVATGAFHRPHVPEIAGAFSTELAQLHSADYRNPDQLPTGRILVVGGGNSGLQIAEELLASRPVSLAVGSRPPALPQRIAGRDVFWFLTRLGLIDQPANSRLARRVRARGDLVIGGTRRRLRSSSLDLRPRLTRADGRVACFVDGTRLTADGVIWATGYRPDYSWIDAAVIGPDQRPRHHEGRSSIPGLWFLGLPWQRNRGSSLLGFVRHDAALIAHQLSEHARR